MSWVLKDGADKYGGIIIVVVVVVNKYNALIIGVGGGYPKICNTYNILLSIGIGSTTEGAPLGFSKFFGKLDRIVLFCNQSSLTSKQNNGK
jgi:hypothetical protein